MKQNGSLSMNDVYSSITESIKTGGNDLTDKNPLPLEDGGPDEKGGFKKSLYDITSGILSGEEDEEETDSKEDEEPKEGKKKEWVKPWEKDKEEDEENLQESVKNTQQKLNTFMAKKSIFDQLYNQCLNENFGQPDATDDLGALGLDDADTDADLGGDFGAEDEGDSVTFTLDRATAQTLIDVLQGALGDGVEEDLGDEDLGDEGGDLNFDDNEEDELNFEEDEETQGTKVAPDKKGAFQGKSNKVSGKVNAKKQHAKPDVTDDTNTTNSAPPIGALQGKGNQVPGSTLKPKADYFK